MIKVFVSGPIRTGNVEKNFEAAMRVHVALLQAGFAVYGAHSLIPAVVVFEDKDFNEVDWDKWGEITQPQTNEWIETCDVFLRLPGESSGADEEINYALGYGKTTFYSVEEIVDYFKVV